GLAVVNPAKPQEFAVFQWRENQGNISPNQLLQTVLGEAEASNIRINSQRNMQPHQTPNGPLYSMVADVSYNSHGSAVRGSFTTAVTNANGYVPFWVGNVVATQSTQADFEADQPVLQHIANSIVGQ